MSDKISDSQYPVNRESNIDSAYPAGMSLGDTIRRLRKSMPDGRGGKDGKGWTQTQLVKAVQDRGGDLSQGQLSAIEAGSVVTPRSLLQIAQVLGVDPDALAKGLVNGHYPHTQPDTDTKATKDSETTANEVQFLRQTTPPRGRRKRSLPVWASAEGGQGAWVVDDHPMAWIEPPENLVDVTGAFAVRLMGTSASPRYEHDDVLYINPSRIIQTGDWCLFLRETRDGTKYAAVKKLVRRTTKVWVVAQLNPAKQIELDRAEWQRAFKVVGTLTDR
jgi:phage repressor protein C with HTH and peptisase S24 domain